MKIKSILESIYGLITNNTDKLSFVIISASVTFFMIGAYLLSYTTYTTITKTKNGWFSDEEESKTIPIHPHEDTGTAVIIFSIVILFLGIGAYFFVDNKSPQITTINSTNELISNSNISVEENKKSLNLTVDNSNNTDTYIQTKNKILKVPTHWYSGLFKDFIVGIFPPLEIYYRYYYSNKIIYEQGWFYYNIKAFLASIFGLFAGFILLGGILSLILGEDDGFPLSLILYGFSFLGILFYVIYKLISFGLNSHAVFITWIF